MEEVERLLYLRAIGEMTDGERQKVFDAIDSENIDALENTISPQRLVSIRQAVRQERESLQRH